MDPMAKSHYNKQENAMAKASLQHSFIIRVYISLNLHSMLDFICSSLVGMERVRLNILHIHYFTNIGEAEKRSERHCSEKL